MKKFLSIYLVAILLCLSACNTQIPKDTVATTEESRTEPTITNISESAPTEPTITNISESAPTEPTITNISESVPTETTSETTEVNPVESNQLPLPEESAEFAFLSGAGGWQSVITLNRDGTFTGCYLDSEMGEIGEGYPNGSAYICDFSGRFENIQKVDEYSYQMTLTIIKTEKPVGEEWIEDGIRYVASDPCGLHDPLNNQACTEFVFFLPDTPVDQVPEEFLFWWPYRYLQESDAKTTLSCYGILNVTTNDGFFTTE